jgi:hypothetical protein
VDEQCAGSVGGYDAQAARSVSDKPDEAVRAEHAHHRCGHVRLESLQRAHLRRDHAVEGECTLAVDPPFVQCGFVVLGSITCRRGFLK